MAVQAQLGGLAGFLPPSGGFADELWALRDYGALMSSSAAMGNKVYQYDVCAAAAGVASAAQSELTCNGGGGGGVALPSRKRAREDDEFERYVASSSAALLPIPGTQNAISPNRTVFQSSPAAMASTSGRPDAASPVVEDALVSELCGHGAEIDALVRAELDRLRAVLEHAHKRRRQAVAFAAARALREKDAELDAARRRAAELEERLRQAAAESHAWCGLARSNEAVASGLRAALDSLLRSGVSTTTGVAFPAAHHQHAADEEGFGDSGGPVVEAAALDDAESCCFAEAQDTAVAMAATSASPASRWACRGCGGGEATVLLLPCRHLCLCKACEPRADACPVCFAVKNAAIHVAGAN